MIIKGGGGEWRSRKVAIGWGRSRSAGGDGEEEDKKSR